MIFNLLKEFRMGKFASGMKKSAALTIFGAAIGALLSGCGGDSSPVPSGSFTTNTIYAFMTAVQDETGEVTTTVQLRDGMASTAHYLYLSNGDILYSSLNQPPQQYLNFSGNIFGSALDLAQHMQVMASRDLFFNYGLFNQSITGKPEYYSFETPSAGTSPVRAYVDFERKGTTMTGTSSIELPGGFQISSPAGASTLSRSTPITLTWNNVDATTTMSLNVAGICDDGNRYSLTWPIGTDTGTATLSSSNYFPAIGVSTSATCMTAFILRRSRLGSLSPQLAFGSFTGAQQRTVQFTTTP
jgi:hypothetical protein